MAKPKKLSKAEKQAHSKAVKLLRKAGYTVYRPPTKEKSGLGGHLSFPYPRDEVDLTRGRESTFSGGCDADPEEPPHLANRVGWY